MAATNEKLQHAYDAAWIQGTPNSENCSGFLKSAGDALGFDLEDGDLVGEFADRDGGQDRAHGCPRYA